MPIADNADKNGIANCLSTAKSVQYFAGKHLIFLCLTALPKTRDFAIMKSLFYFENDDKA